MSCSASVSLHFIHSSSGVLIVHLIVATMDNILDVFKPECLQTDNALTTALVTFEKTLGKHNVFAILSRSLETPHSLPFILSR